MSSRVAGAALAVLAALALVSASAGVPWGWWDGHPRIGGRVIEAKDVTVSLLSAQGCNTGGDKQCQPLALPGSFTTLSLVELGASGLLIAALVLLALTTLVGADSRRTLAKVVLVLAAIAVVLAGTLLVLGPQMTSTQVVVLPLGPGLYLFAGAIACALAGGVVTLRAPAGIAAVVGAAPPAYGAPYPGYAPHAPGYAPPAHGFAPGSTGFPPHPTGQPTQASAEHPPAPVANMTLPIGPPPAPAWAGAASTSAPGPFDGKASFVRGPALPAPVSPGGLLPGPTGPLGGGAPGPALRPLHEHPGAPPAFTSGRPGTLPPPNRSATPPSAPARAAAPPMTLAGAPNAPLRARPTSVAPPAAAVPMTLAGAVAPPRALTPPPGRPPTPLPTRSTIATAAVPAPRTSSPAITPPPLVDAEPTSTTPFPTEDSLDEPEYTEAGDIPEPRDTSVQDIPDSVSVGLAPTSLAPRPGIHDRDSEADIATVGHDRFDAADLDGDEGTQTSDPPIPPPPATVAPPRGPSGKVPIPMSTASPSLPPPAPQIAAANSPSPACPQCEAPMAWVEEHLRFYCKSCRMYF